MRYSESGRSMLEIIAVMALIGVFTYGSVVAFQAGMNSVRSKYIIEQMMVRVNEIVSNTELSKGHGKLVYTPEYVNKTKEGSYGYKFDVEDKSLDPKSLAYYLAGEKARDVYVEVSVSGRISSGVCGNLKGRMATLGTVESAKTNGGVDLIKNACPKSDITKITFRVRKSSSPSK